MDVRTKINNGDYNNRMPYPNGTSQADKIARLDFRQNEGVIKAQFKLDVLRELGIEKHRNAEKLFEIAWERGHSSGWHDVLSEAEELSELLLMSDQNQTNSSVSSESQLTESQEDAIELVFKLKKHRDQLIQIKHYSPEINRQSAIQLEQVYNLLTKVMNQVYQTKMR